MEAAMVVCGNEEEMEENGFFCSAWTGICGRRFVRGRVCSGCCGVGSPFAVPCVNRSVGGTDGGVEELTFQVKWFLLLN